MERKILVFDPYLCTGCMYCMTACSTYNEGSTSFSKARLHIFRHEGHALTKTNEVDGEVFSVKISPVWDGTGRAETTMEAEVPKAAKRPKELPAGAVLCGMAGLVLSIEAKVGAHVNAGDLVAMIEVMKMRRHVNSPRSGVVKEILAREGEMVAPEDILMVVE